MLRGYDSSDDDMEYARPVGGGYHRRLLPAIPVAPAQLDPTSTTEPLSISWLSLGTVGFSESVAISELPGANFRDRRRNLLRDIRTIISSGVTDVVCLLTRPEFAKFRVPDLLNEYEKAGLIVYYYPVEDGMVPLDVRSLKQLIRKIRIRIGDGNRVLVHCYGGLGRAVLVGACLTLELDVDMTPSEVIEQMRLLRGPRAVQSVKQYNFIYEYRDLSSEANPGPGFDSEEDQCISR